MAAVANATSGKALTLDISDEAEIARAVETANTFMGGIDGEVNAAGILRAVPLEQTTSKGGINTPPMMASYGASRLGLSR